MNEQDKTTGIENGFEPPIETQTIPTPENNLVSEEIPHRAYMDASYQPQSEATGEPKTYYTPPAKQPKQKEPKKGPGFGGLVAACLVCSLLGGLGGGAIVSGQMSKEAEENPSGSVLNIAPPSSPTPLGTAVAAGQTLSGAQIYALGCEQAVGITTERTYTNFMGMETSAPVSGSGFIASSDGYIVTNYHVISDAVAGNYKVSVVLFNGDTYEAKIIGGEEQNDIAVLKIEATGLSAATLGDSSALQVGEAIYAIGNPLGELNFSMSTGSVSALDRNITTGDRTTGKTTTNNMFQIDAAVNSGNSGGPLYNDRGQVVGIVTAKYSNNGVEGLGFAIPVNDIVSIVDDLIENGFVTGKPYFGVVVSTVNSQAVQYFDMAQGAYVETVTEGACTDKAGLKVGDIITAIDDKAITSVSDLTTAKRDYKAGDTVTMTISREGETLTLTVVLDEEKPADSVLKPIEKTQRGIPAA